jgi:hypothetical protein
MTQTLIYAIPHSKLYTRFTQNDSTYLPLHPPKPPLNNTNTEASTLQAFKRPPHVKETPTRRTREQEQQRQVSKMHNKHT